MKKMWNFTRAGALLVICFAVTCAAAQGYPSKPIRREAGRALADAEVKERLTARGFDIVASSPEALAAFLKVESEASGRLIRQGKISAE
ncbi:MAG TPA: hypothetical protein VN929_14965 [Burkholderiales bacterium]|nr:hypothetical protein [Burkholderiales bacterium]